VEIGAKMKQLSVSFILVILKNEIRLEIMDINVFKNNRQIKIINNISIGSHAPRPSIKV
jgi:hypothetical protein